jgi:hypothetical protein
MPRKPTDTTHISLRIRESLRRKLEREADKHQTSLNNEIRLRLEDSFEAQARRELPESVQDLKTTVAKLSARAVLSTLEEKIAQAAAQSNDLGEIKTLLRDWLNIKRAEAKARMESLS